MIKLVIFDLDGVLVEAKEIHYKTLNQAILNVTRDSDMVIGWEEHLSVYDGRKTNEKLDMLTERKGLLKIFHKDIWETKQKLTLEALDSLEENEYLQFLFKNLVKDGYKIACCSNSIRKTVLTVLSKLGVIKYMDLIISNEDVKNSKPHPEMYWKAMSILGVLPEETLIVEDSPPGLLAAARSRAKVLRVSKPSDVRYETIYAQLKETRGRIMPKWQDTKMNVLIPMAGAGSRFQQAGYTFPKPLIDVNGKPMIEVVTDNLNIDAQFIYVVQKEHRKNYNLDTMLNLISPGCKIVEVDGITEGAACTTLLAKDFIDNDYPLLMANSDQFVEWDSNEFMYKMLEQQVDGGMVTFRATHPKWSFAKIDENGYVTEVAEKNPISDIATVGIYYWKRGSDYVRFAEQMIQKDIRVNNEFYVCPVFNQAIEAGRKIRTFDVPAMWGIGTPEDLTYFLENYKGV
jgi:beta-phosphoglucomutase-like phosphatase (HAD superfamily)/dTDP-glucose pyrophosphorylase